MFIRQTNLLLILAAVTILAGLIIFAYNLNQMESFGKKKVSTVGQLNNVPEKLRSFLPQYGVRELITTKLSKIIALANILWAAENEKEFLGIQINRYTGLAFVLADDGQYKVLNFESTFIAGAADELIKYLKNLATSITPQ